MEEDDDDESSDSDASDKNVKKSRQLSSVVKVKQVNKLIWQQSLSLI